MRRTLEPAALEERERPRLSLGAVYKSPRTLCVRKAAGSVRKPHPPAPGARLAPTLDLTHGSPALLRTSARLTNIPDPPLRTLRFWHSVIYEQMGFKRQLSSAEIFEQAYRFSQELAAKGDRLSNVVRCGARVRC